MRCVHTFAPAAMSGHQWVTLAIGFVVSFFVAWVVVAWFMAWVRRHGFVPFAIYRIALGLVILAGLALRPPSRRALVRTGDTEPKALGRSRRDGFRRGIAGGLRAGPWGRLPGWEKAVRFDDSLTARAHNPAGMV